jgi:hypothetical protein
MSAVLENLIEEFGSRLEGIESADKLFLVSVIGVYLQYQPASDSDQEAMDETLRILEIPAQECSEDVYEVAQSLTGESVSDLIGLLEALTAQLKSHLVRGDFE